MRFYPRMSVEEYKAECGRDEQRTKEALANFHKREHPGGRNLLVFFFTVTGALVGLYFMFDWILKQVGLP